MNPLSRLRFEHLVVLAALLALVIGTSLLSRRPEAPSEERETIEAGQSLAVTRSGAMAMALLLQKIGASVDRLRSRLDLIPPGAGVVVSVATPNRALLESAGPAMFRPKVDFAPEEMTALVSWLAGGGTFVWLPQEGDVNAPHLRQLGLDWTEELPSAEPKVVTLDLSLVRRDLGNAYRMQVRSRRRLRRAPDAAQEAIPLAQDDHGWVAALVPVRQGRAVVFCDWRIARNDTLRAEDHDVLLAHLLVSSAGGRTIAFDEYHHGAEETGFFAYVLKTPAGDVLLHVGLAIVVFLLATGSRLGPPHDAHEERRRRPVEFMEAFARLCRASRNAGLAVQLVLTNVLDSIHHRFGRSDPDTVEREAAKRGLNAQEIRAHLDGARRAAQGRPSPQEMLRWIQRLERVRQAVMTSNRR